MADEYFEYEASRTRSEIATSLRAIADELDGDGPITFSSGSRTISVTPPERPWFELEVERGEEVEIEIELEWDRRESGRRGSTGGLAVESVNSDDEPATGDEAVEGAFELYEDSAGKWRFRLVSEGPILANSSGGRESREEARRIVERIRRVVPEAAVKGDESS